MKKIFSCIVVTFMWWQASAQLMVGAAVGTFNAYAAAEKFKPIGPTIKIEYADSYSQSVYLDCSLYNKTQDAGTTTITDIDGAYIGEAETTVKYSIKNLQLGFKRIMGKNLSEKGFSFFLGGGAALALVKSTYKYHLSGENISDSKYNQSIFGFHFNAGVQYNFSILIVELKGNFDIMLKPIAGGDSYLTSGTRLGVIIPLTKE